MAKRRTYWLASALALNFAILIALGIAAWRSQHHPPRCVAGGAATLFTNCNATP